MLNILTAPLIRIDRRGHPRILASLPEVYAALMQDQVDSFPGLRAHQRHPWHAFLVQLAVIALRRNDYDRIPEDPDVWLCLLNNLTPEWPAGEPWLLAVTDITQPAFLQPPASNSTKLSDYKTELNAPDEADIIVTSKNHDVKLSPRGAAAPDQWLFALITLQTSGGFSGAGNYGISRMNGGLGNRPAFSLAPLNLNPGPHVRRDIAALLENLDDYLPQFQNATGAALLWTLPWDGHAAEALDPRSLDPFYIEVCRRIRLIADAPPHQGGIRAIRATSKAPRIDAKALQGRTGDPWTPTDAKREGLPLTLGPGGFTYKRVAAYLTSDEWTPPFLLKPTAKEAEAGTPMRLAARATVRGQGKTEGYHERSIPIEKETLESLAKNDLRELGRLAKERIDEAAAVQRIMAHAIYAFLNRDDTESTGAGLSQTSAVQRYVNDLDAAIDRTFFEELQKEFKAPDHDRTRLRRLWLNNDDDGVVDQARRLMRQAIESLPCPTAYQDKAVSKATQIFEGRIRGANGVPHAYAVLDGDEAELPTMKWKPEYPGKDEWGNTAAAICIRIANAKSWEIASLRRMAPGSTPAPAYWRIMSDHNLLRYSPASEEKWALVIHGIAVTTPKAGTEHYSQTAHNSNMPVGKALYEGNYTELRLGRILRAEGPTLHSLLSECFRTLANKGIRFNWREMARFIMAQAVDQDNADRRRRRIFRDYYRQVSKSQPTG